MTHSKLKTELVPLGRKQPSEKRTEVEKLKIADSNADSPLAQEVGGRDGPDPTRYGDWEKNGRCVDF